MFQFHFLAERFIKVDVSMRIIGTFTNINTTTDRVTAALRGTARIVAEIDSHCISTTAARFTILVNLLEGPNIELESIIMLTISPVNVPPILTCNWRVIINQSHIRLLATLESIWISIYLYPLSSRVQRRPLGLQLQGLYSVHPQSMMIAALPLQPGTPLMTEPTNFGAQLRTITGQQPLQPQLEQDPIYVGNEIDDSAKIIIFNNYCCKWSP